MDECQECKRLRAEMAVMDGALAIHEQVLAALQGLIPNPESLAPEEYAKWKRVVDAIFRGAEYMDLHQVGHRHATGWLN